MRVSLVGIFSLFLIFISLSPTYAKIDTKTIVGMWLFDEGSGNVTKDYSGNGNDGTLKGPKWVNGKFGRLLSLTV